MFDDPVSTAAKSGRVADFCPISRMCASRFSSSLTVIWPSVESIRMSVRSRIFATISAYTSGAWQGLPSGLRAWKWMMEAPASRHSRAVSAISSGVNGTLRFTARDMYSFTRTVMMSFFMPWP